jgi:hypothetical protein
LLATAELAGCIMFENYAAWMASCSPTNQRLPPGIERLYTEVLNEESGHVG